MRRLAVVYDRGSAGPAELSAAARALDVEPVLVIDSASEHVAQVLPALRRRFTLVDTAGMSPDEVAAATVRLSGVVTFSDLCLPVASALAARLGTPHWHSPEVTAVLRDKAAQRRALAAHGVDATRYAVITTGSAVAGALAVTGLPAVLKPHNGTAGQHVTRVDDLAAAEAAARRFFATAPTGSVLVAEELLIGDPEVAGPAFGDYVSVEAAVHDGAVLPLGVVGKLPLEPPFRERGFFLPATLDAAITERVLAVAEAAVLALGIRTGVVHTELKLTAAGPRVIEVNGRVGGHVPDLFDRAFGYSMVETAFRLALGDPPVAPEHAGAGVTYQYVFLPPTDATAVEGVEGLAELHAHAGVDVVDVRVTPGQRVSWREGAFSRLGKVYGRVPDHTALAELVTRIEDTTRFRFTRDDTVAPQVTANRQ